MTRLIAVTAAVLLLASSMAGAQPAPAKTHKGLQNSKKVMQANFDRFKRVEDVKKRAHARKEAQRQKEKAAPSQQ